jgi:hypothetical protein
MRESGISARGVDLNLDMILPCREKGLLLQAPGTDVGRFNEGIGQKSLARPHETLPSSERGS